MSLLRAAHLLPIWLPSLVQVLLVCAAPCCGALPMCHRRREQKTDPLRPLPTYADALCSTGQAGDQSSHVPLSDDEQHAALAGPLHTTHHNHAPCDARVLLVRHVGAQFSIETAESSNEDQVQLEGGQVERLLLDRQGQK